MMRIEVNNKGEFVLSEVYNGIGIQTDCGMYGIAQRDGGIEVMLDGKLVYAPTICCEPTPAKPLVCRACDTEIECLVCPACHAEFYES